MVKDVKTGDCFRADHLIEGESMLHLGRVEGKGWGTVGRASGHVERFQDFMVKDVKI